MLSGFPCAVCSQRQDHARAETLAAYVPDVIINVILGEERVITDPFWNCPGENGGHNQRITGTGFCYEPPFVAAGAGEVVTGVLAEENGVS